LLLDAHFLVLLLDVDVLLPGVDGLLLLQQLLVLVGQLGLGFGK